MNRKTLLGTLEAILFACGEPVALDKLLEAAETTEIELRSALEELKEKYNTPESGIQLLELDGSFQFATNPAYIEPVRTALDLRRNTPLSQAAMEVLAVVAYNQPVTKAFVEQVRGVDCSGVIGSLIAKGLLEERGRLELPGRPLLYGTTENFLRCMQIDSLSGLPPLPKQQDEEDAPAQEESSPEEVSP